MKKQIFGWAFSVIAGFMFTTTLVACDSNKGSGSSTVAPGVPGYSNIAAIPNAVPLYSNVQSSSASGDFQMNVTIYGQGGYGAIGAGGYSPMSAIQGTMTVNPGNISFCGAMPGTYTINTVQPGILSGTSIGPMDLQAVGPQMITMSVSYGIITSNGPRLSLNANIYVNGMPCGPLVTL